MTDQNSENRIRNGQQALHTGRTAARAVSRAAAGDAGGAAMTVLTDKNSRRTVVRAVLAVLLLLSSLVVFVLYLVPMAVYEVTVETLAGADNAFWKGFYGSDLPGWQGVVKGVTSGTVSWVQNAWQSVRNLVSLLFRGTDAVHLNAVENGKEAEITVISDQTAVSASLTDKMDLVQEKYASRVNELEECIRSTSGRWLDRAARRQFEQDYTAGWDIYGPDGKGEQHAENLLIPACVIRELSDRQKLRFCALYDVLHDNDFGSTEIADFLKWLGYPASPGDTLKLRVPEDEIPVSGWTGTFLPRYLLDEAISRADQEYAASLNAEEENPKGSAAPGKEIIELRKQFVEEYRNTYGVSALDLNLYSYIGTLSSVPVPGENRDTKNLMKVRTDGEVVASKSRRSMLYQGEGEMKEYYRQYGDKGNYTYFGWKYDLDGTPLYDSFCSRFFSTYLPESGADGTGGPEGCILSREVSVFRTVRRTVSRPVQVAVSSRGEKTIDGCRQNPYWGNREAERKFRAYCKQNGWSCRWGPSDVCAWSVGRSGAPIYHSFLFYIDWETEILVPATLVMAKAYKYYYVVSYTCPYYIALRPESEMLELAGIRTGARDFAEDIPA